MQELVIEKMENVYGIKKMRLNIDEGKSLFQNVIYSRNGVFKTSFANCLYELSNGNKKEIRDRITNEPANIDMKIINDGKIEKL